MKQKSFSKTFGPVCHICGKSAEYIDKGTPSIEFICKDHMLEHTMRKNNLI